MAAASRLLPCLALTVATACAGTDPGAAGEGTDAASTGATSTASTGLASASTGGSGSTGAGPTPCTTIDCPEGEVGCPCAADACAGAAACENGTCVHASDGMVLVREGPFCMGCDPERDPGCISDELPAHEVWLPDFEIDRHEVTQSAWQACIDAGVCPVPDMRDTCVNKWDPVALAEHPVVCIDHTASAAYCEWVGKRLPTEAEWEKAARGVDGRLFPWGDDPPTCDLANFESVDGECVDATTPSGSYAAGMSPYGVHDMAGSVWERTADWYAPDYYQHAPDASPPGAPDGSAKVLRGGGFTSVQKFLRVSARDGARAPWKTARNVGLRCARSIAR